MFKLQQINALHTVKEKTGLEEWSREQSNICIIIFFIIIKKGIVNIIYTHMSPTCLLISDLCCRILQDKICKRRHSFYSMDYTVHLLFPAIIVGSKEVFASLESFLLSYQQDQNYNNITMMAKIGFKR